MALGKRSEIDERPNLLGAIRHLINPNKTIDIDDANQQLIEIGLEPIFHTENQDKDFLVLPENWPALLLIQRCSTQWRKTIASSMAGTTVFYEGLDYQAVDLLINAFYSDEDKADLWGRLQVLEREAVTLFNAKN